MEQGFFRDGKVSAWSNPGGPGPSRIHRKIPMFFLRGPQ